MIVSPYQYQEELQPLSHDGSNVCIWCSPSANGMRRETASEFGSSLN